MDTLASPPMGRCSPPRPCSTRGSRSPTPATRCEKDNSPVNYLTFPPPGFFLVSARAGRATSVRPRWTLDWRHPCLLSVTPTNIQTMLLASWICYCWHKQFWLRRHLWKKRCLISVCLQWKTWHWGSRRRSRTCCGATSRGWRWTATQTPAASHPGRKVLAGGRSKLIIDGGDNDYDWADPRSEPFLVTTSLCFLLRSWAYIYSLCVWQILLEFITATAVCAFQSTNRPQVGARCIFPRLTRGDTFYFRNCPLLAAGLHFLPHYPLSFLNCQLIELGLNTYMLSVAPFCGAHVLVHFVPTPSLDSISLG